ncbi:nuclear transport factor 2 family protein [Microbacterium abyssi]|uniref:nuclear transport factor 2 family protein n=1 Tax=Microbacterium abyssi TaxID=2782166 RepID=UPI0018890C32|nr:nuclear transport factor 2 family protein [Microbacterium sp. A18JL241]
MPDLHSIADRLELIDLIGRIAQLADSGTPEDYLDCFTEDAVWDLTNAAGLPMDVQTIRGRAALLAGVHERRDAGVQGPGTHTRHDVSSIVIEVDGDRARARSYFRYYRKTDAVPELVAMGAYVDAFTLTPEGWRLQRRIISRD